MEELVHAGTKLSHSIAAGPKISTKKRRAPQPPQPLGPACTPPPLVITLQPLPQHQGPHPPPSADPEAQKNATDILRKMLEQEEAELQNLLEEQSRNPTPSLKERIESLRRRANQVRVKIQQDVRKGATVSKVLEKRESVVSVTPSSFSELLDMLRN
ncbi:leiomodin-2-like [Sinocyclocheilus rhinocerous]|uniref:leiomodin-2-like n=1 Tax=Sinocyclocheilus rhinocerous TaxID=307959 RepID=UPI0007B93EA1|nr:PREDICTED: leiomodin-2-like [Sinocyclocheilus rhinocerous]